MRFHDISEITNPAIRAQVAKKLGSSHQEKKKPKYGNEKDERTIGKITYKFDSRKEAKYFDELVIMLKAKLISNLVPQPKFEIIPTLAWGDITLKKIVYYADFSYTDIDGNKIVVDVKGCKTDVYGLKKRLFIMQNPDKTFVEIY